jgi:hypothetical protein
MFWIAYLTKLRQYAFKQTTEQEAMYHAGLEHKKFKIKVKRSNHRLYNSPSNGSLTISSNSLPFHTSFANATVDD